MATPQRKSIRRSSRRALSGNCGGTHTCANCGCGFTGNYCNECGQHYDTKRLSTRELWDNITFSLVNFDRGIPNTVRRLFADPGRMIKEYIVGHRVSYSHPVAMLLLLCTVYGLVVGICYAALPGGIPAGGEAPMPAGDSSAFGRILSYLFDRLMGSTLFNVLLPVPFYALVMRRLFRRYGSRGYNYAEMLFMCLYMACQRMVVAVVIEPFEIFFPDSDIFSFIQGALSVLLAAWCFRGFFGAAWGRAIWKSLLMFVLGWAALIVLIILLAILLLFLGVVIGVAGGALDVDFGNGIKEALRDAAG